MNQLVSSLFLCCTLLSTGQTPGFQWVRYTGSGARAYGITTDRSGDIYVTGHYQDSLHFLPPAGTNTLYSQYQNAFVLKMSPNGNLIWLKDDFHLEGWAIAVDSIKNIYISGYTGFITKLDSMGNPIWSKSPSTIGTSQVAGWSIALDASGNVYGCGSFANAGYPYDFDPGPATFTMTPVGPSDAYFWKLDGNGNFVWAKRIGGSQCEARSICVDQAGNLISTGNFNSQIDCDPGPATYSLMCPNWAAFVLKLDQNGNFVWARKTGDFYASGFSVCTDNNNDVYTTGDFSGITDFDPGPGTFTLNSTGWPDCYISKLSASGNFIWSKCVGSKFDQRGKAIAADISGDVWVAGFFRDSVNYYTDFDPGPGTCTVNAGQGTFFLKLDNNGNFKGVNHIRDLSAGTTLQTIALTKRGNVYATGYFNGDVIFDTGTGQDTVSVSMFGEHVFIYKLNDLTVGLAETQVENEVAVFPNPAATSICIRAANSHSALVRIFGTDGSLQFEHTLSSSTAMLDVSCLSAGLYLLQVEFADRIRSSKFVKE